MNELFGFLFLLIFVLGGFSLSFASKFSPVDLLPAVECYMISHPLPSRPKELLFKSERCPTVEEYQKSKKDWYKLQAVYDTEKKSPGTLKAKEFISMFCGLLDFARMGHKSSLSCLTRVFKEGLLGFEKNFDYEMAFSAASHGSSWDVAASLIVDEKWTDYEELLRDLRPALFESEIKEGTGALEKEPVGDLKEDGRSRGSSGSSTDIGEPSPPESAAIGTSEIILEDGAPISDKTPPLLGGSRKRR